MKMPCLLLAAVAFAGGASGQAPTATQTQTPVAVSEVEWGEHALITSARNYSSSVHKTLYMMTVTVTNTGTLPVESVRVAFVFADPDTGAELFRYKSRSKKSLLPGESRIIQKAVLARPGWYPTIDELAAKSAVVTEVRYSDGSVWRPR